MVGACEDARVDAKRSNAVSDIDLRECEVVERYFCRDRDDKFVSGQWKQRVGV